MYVVRAAQIYNSLYPSPKEDMLIFVDFVRALKRAPPGRTVGVTIRFLSYALSPKTAWGVPSIEGLFQGAVLEYMAGGITAKHGAPIPIKRVVVKGNGGTARVFASTFPLMTVKRKAGGELVNRHYAPLLDGYADAEVRDGITILGNEVRSFHDFTDVSVAMRGGLFEVWYDYPRLSKRPPRDVYGFDFEPQRGPMHNAIRRLRVITAGLTYFFNYPRLRPDIDREFRKVVYGLPDIQLGGYGFLGQGVIGDYVVGTLRGWEPWKYLFAEYGRYYVLLRPLPAHVIPKSYVVRGRGRKMSLKPAPPYYASPMARSPTIHYLPGVVLRDIPSVEWEVA